MSKKYLTFLGAGEYINCNYFFGETDHISKNRAYIQVAIAELFCKNWNEKDKIVVFTTEKARNKHFKNLKKNLKSIHGLDVNINNKMIPDGKSEEEIWNIFEIVSNSVDEGDEIIFDITHAFRFQPLLGYSVLNFLKNVKNIKINKIFYGAFEVLGNKKEVKNIPLEKRNAPIFDLTLFDRINEWSQATNVFTKLGNPEFLKMIFEKESKNYFINKKDNKENFLNMKEVGGKLDKIFNYITTNRGNKLIQMKDIDDINENLEQLKNKKLELKPFKMLITEIKNKINNFKKNNINNLFVAVKFSINHELYQQAITLFLEGIITYIADKIGFGFNNKDERNEIKAYLHDKCSNYNKEISEIEKIKDIKNIFVKLNQLRNDINHAGFRKNCRNYNTIIKNIKNYYEEFKKLELN